MMYILDEIILFLLIFVGLVWFHRQYQAQSAKPTKARTYSATDISVQAKSDELGRRKPVRNNAQSKTHQLDISNLSTDDSDPAAPTTDSSETDASSQVRSANLKHALEMRKRARPSTGDAPTLNSVGSRLENVLRKLSPEDAALLKSCLNAKDKRAIRTSLDSEQPVSLATSQNRPWLANPQQISENSLRANLQKLATYDSERVLMVKKINKLGFDSSCSLKAHFSKFGKVTEVFVTHGIDRRTNPSKPKFRPAAVGFVVMENIENAAMALQVGPEHDVLGAPITAGSNYQCRPGATITVGRFRNVVPQGSTLDEENDVNESNDLTELNECADCISENTEVLLAASCQ